MRNRITRHSWRLLSFLDHAICRNACQTSSPMAPSFPLTYSMVRVEVVLETPLWSSMYGKQGWGPGGRWGHKDRWEALRGAWVRLWTRGGSQGALWTIERVSMSSDRCGVELGCRRWYLPLSWRNEWWWSCSGKIRVIIEFCGCLYPSSHYMLSSHCMCSSLEVDLLVAPGQHRGCAIDVPCVDQLIGNTLRSLSWGGWGWQFQQAVSLALPWKADNLDLINMPIHISNELFSVD